MRCRSFGSRRADGAATPVRWIRAVRRLVIAVCAAAAVVAPVASRAQADFPSRPMKLVSPFNPGGAVDVLNRMIAEKMAARLKQPIVVEAIPGANTILGTQALLKAPPDGHTFMITTMSTQVNNPSLYSKLPYDADRDLAPITQVALGAVLLVGPVDAPYRDLPGFIAWARAQKRPVTFGSWGVGSSAHLYGEMLRRDYGIDLLHVPYKGEQPALIDVVNGSLDVTFASPVGAKPQVTAGKVRALGMTGPRRSASMPELATFGEQGVRGMDLPVWVGAYAPAGTPRPVIERLQREIREVIALPDVSQKMIDVGFTPWANTPDEFAANLKADVPVWAALIRASGAKAE
jgi:tripartite-type tricarboxylate transporter receptor subunit TctC